MVYRRFHVARWHCYHQEEYEQFSRCPWGSQCSQQESADQLGSKGNVRENTSKQKTYMKKCKQKSIYSYMRICFFTYRGLFCNTYTKSWMYIRKWRMKPKHLGNLRVSGYFATSWSQDFPLRCNKRHQAISANILDNSVTRAGLKWMLTILLQWRSDD